ncbi:MAG: serine/threonine protein kinase [Planctomycetaceae bacterium]|nr:serine/threonine protein kinase [Planctomycetaceae bacterium]
MLSSNTQCDASLVGRYLSQQLSVDEEAALVAHVDHCTACRGLLDDSAAEDSWWSEASQYLPTDEWDGPASVTHVDALWATGEGDELSDDAGVVRRLSGWLDPTDDPHRLGRFGGYEIAGVIGEGGMGVVLKGHEPALNRFVAIKVLAPHLASNGAARQRFSREAQAAAAVLHENVIAIHRVEESHGLPYLVMPYIAGQSLQRRIDREGPLPLVAVLRIGRQIAAGLAAAHAQGLVHRDVKPANILLERGVDRVTLTDFGLARAVDDATVTRSGIIAGTPQYMSPEQARGDPIDGRSDLFSLGSVIYAMCTGRPPFRAETGYGILRRITDTEPRSIREINADIPDWLEAIVARLHKKAPANRFQSSDEVADLLERCLAHVQQPTSVPLPVGIPPLVVRPAACVAALNAQPGGPKFSAKRLFFALTAIVMTVAAAVALWPKAPPQEVEQYTGAKVPDPSAADLFADSPSDRSPDASSDRWDDHLSHELESIGSDLDDLNEELKANP